MYMEDHIFLVLSIKNLIKEDTNPTTTFKLATCTKPSISHYRILFCPCVEHKATAHVGTEELNMLRQRKSVFVVSLLEFHSIKKGILFTYHTYGR